MNKPYKRCIVKALALLTAVFIPLSGMVWQPGVVARAESLSDLQNQLDSLKNEASAIHRKLEDARKNAASQEAYKNSLNDQIQNMVAQINIQNKQIKLLGEEIDAANAGISQREESIAAKNEDIRNCYGQLGKRLRQMSKGGHMSFFQILFNKGSYVDYLYQVKLTEKMTEHDQQLMDEMEAEIETLNGEKSMLAQEKENLQLQKNEQEAIKAAADGKKRELDALYKEARKLLNEMNQDAQQLAQREKEIERQQKALDEKIASIKYSDGKYTGGTMFWPVPVVKYIFRGFQTQGGRVTHKGIDISSHPTIPIFGQDIIAAADGVVVYANPNDNRPGASKGGGYGYFVLVDHGQDSRGKNIRTLYAHCSVLSVREGDKVIGGKTKLGEVGETGDSSGPHLHFEVRENNIPVDPFQKGYVRLK